MTNAERSAWVKIVLLLVSCCALAVFFAHVDEMKERSVYEQGRQAGLVEARRAARYDEPRQQQAIDRARHEAEEECEDSLARQRGVLVQQIEECQGELAVSRQNERR